MRKTEIHKIEIFNQDENPMPESFNVSDLPPLRMPSRAHMDCDDLFYQLKHGESVVYNNEYVGLHIYATLLFLTKTVSYQVKYMANKYPDRVIIWRTK